MMRLLFSISIFRSPVELAEYSGYKESFRTIFAEGPRRVTGLPFIAYAIYGVRVKNYEE